MEPTNILNAEHLAAEEEAYLAGTVKEPKGLTLQDAVDSIRRLKWHQARLDTIEAEADALLAPLEAEMERIENWREELCASVQKSIDFHNSRLTAYYQLHRPIKGKTISLPGGKVREEAQQPEWRYPDDDTLVAVVKTIRPDLVSAKQVESVNKADLKKAVRYYDDSGKVMLTNHLGELVELPIIVTPRPPKVTVEID